MRITSQPAAELSTATTATAKAPATPAAPSDFGAALAVASEATVPPMTHGTSDRGADKKSDRTKTADTGTSATASQIPTNQLASLIIPATTSTFTLGLPASIQNAAPQGLDQSNDAGNGGNSAPGGLQFAGTTAATSGSSIPGATTSSLPAIVPQGLLMTPIAMPLSASSPLANVKPGIGSSPVSNVKTAQNAPTATLPSPQTLPVPETLTAATQTQPEPVAANVPTTVEIPLTSTISATPATPNVSQPASAIKSASPAATPQAPAGSADLSTAVSPDAAPVDGARVFTIPANVTAVTVTSTEAVPSPQVQSGSNPIPANPASVDAAPITTQSAGADQNATVTPDATNLSVLPTPVPATGVDVIQNVSAPNSFVKAQTSTVVPKDNGVKQVALSGKDRPSAADLKGKRKSDDSDAEFSNVATSDAPSDAKPVAVSPQFSQGESGQQAGQHQAGNEVLVQQAVQAPVTITSPSHTTPQSVSATPVSTAVPASTQSAQASPVDGTASTAVNNAQLIQSIHQSDMRLGMHSPDFGAISINTSLTHQALSAQISTDHTELGRALAMHLPSIEEKLGNAYGIHAKVEVRDSSTASYGDSSQQQSQSQQAKGNRQGQDQGQGQAGSFTANTSPMLATMTAFSSSSASVASSDARLDIRI